MSPGVCSGLLCNGEWQDWQLRLVAVFDGISAGSNARCPGSLPPRSAAATAAPPLLAATSPSTFGLRSSRPAAAAVGRWVAASLDLCEPPTVWMIYPGNVPTVTSPAGMMLADIGGVSTGQGTGGYPQTGAGGHLGLDKTVSAAPS